MPLAHDGMYVVCSFCRAPLRVALRSSEPIDLGPQGPQILGPAQGSVECLNCGADHGDFDSFTHDYHETMRISEPLVQQ